MSTARKFAVGAALTAGALAAAGVVLVWVVREVMEQAERNLADINIDELVERWLGFVEDDTWGEAA
jgi:hypothetical protein